MPEVTDHAWHRVIPLLSERFTVIAPDVRGSGDSARPDGGYDIPTIATDVAELMTALGHERFAVAGEDRGAAFAAFARSSRSTGRRSPTSSSTGSGRPAGSRCPC